MVSRRAHTRHLPTLPRGGADSGASAADLRQLRLRCGVDCDERSSTYGGVLLQAPEGYFDDARQENVYEEPVLLARSFSDVLAALEGTQDVTKASRRDGTHEGR